MTKPVQTNDLTQFCHSVLSAVGADFETARDCTGSMMHGSIHGIDSHGVRLLGHYAKALQGGRLNKTPQLKFTRTRASSGMLHGDNAQRARDLRSGRARLRFSGRGWGWCRWDHKFIAFWTGGRLCDARDTARHVGTGNLQQ